MAKEMEVVKYLKKNGLRGLKDVYSGAIRTKEYDDLIVLNYIQIQSTKDDAIVNECRGLILDYNWNVVSRAFDRFFNIGDGGTTFDPSSCQVFEKIDGSLIKIYNYKDQWYVSTRGTAYAEFEVHDSEMTYKEMVLKALKLENDVYFQDFCNQNMNKDYTYIFEVTGPENRIVTIYKDYSLWFLAIRHNQTGVYKKPFHIENVKYPKCYKFTSVEECIAAAKALPDLQEGYVAYNQEGEPICKVKSPAYVAVHHLRENGLTEKNICNLLITNEHEEYLVYFPEDAHYFTPYILAMKQTLEEAERVYNNVKMLASQKDFALQVKDYPWSSFAFKARKENTSIYSAFYESEDNFKIKFLMNIVKKSEIKDGILIGVE